MCVCEACCAPVVCPSDGIVVLPLYLVFTLPTSEGLRPVALLSDASDSSGRCRIGLVKHNKWYPSWASLTTAARKLLGVREHLDPMRAWSVRTAEGWHTLAELGAGLTMLRPGLKSVLDTKPPTTWCTATRKRGRSEAPPLASVERPPSWHSTQVETMVRGTAPVLWTSQFVLRLLYDCVVLPDMISLCVSHPSTSARLPTVLVSLRHCGDGSHIRVELPLSSVVYIDKYVEHVQKLDKSLFKSFRPRLGLI